MVIIHLFSLPEGLDREDALATAREKAHAGDKAVASTLVGYLSADQTVRPHVEYYNGGATRIAGGEEDDCDSPTDADLAPPTEGCEGTEGGPGGRGGSGRVRWSRAKVGMGITIPALMLEGS